MRSSDGLTQDTQRLTLTRGGCQAWPAYEHEEASVSDASRRAAW